ncbi:MAG TPA: hypothetical protein VG603_04230 [Chitinophagales bacterium]|nr:hypothetical protein [Chitinophagales bacterium]
MPFSRFFKKSYKEEFEALLGQLRFCRTKSDFIVLSPIPTGYSWMGVYNGGKSMFAENFTGLPHYYSNSVFNEEQLAKLAQELAALGFNQILFNGFAPYFSGLIQDIKKEQPGVITGVIYHGFPAEISGNETVQTALNGIIHLSKSGSLQKMGFAKKGFGAAFEKLFGIPAFELIYINPEPLKQIEKYNDGKTHIGVLVNNSFRKNFHTQVMAGLLVENSVVHVLDASELGYLEAGERIVAHGQQQHADFIKLLAAMDLNMHVTFSEASGGQVCSESISQGVPCLSGYTSSFFDYNEELRNTLVVEGGDDPYFIYLKAKEVLAQKGLGEKCAAYGAYLNTLARERIEKFLAYKP